MWRPGGSSGEKWSTWARRVLPQITSFAQSPRKKSLYEKPKKSSRNGLARSLKIRRICAGSSLKGISIAWSNWCPIPKEKLLMVKEGLQDLKKGDLFFSRWQVRPSNEIHWIESYDWCVPRGPSDAGGNFRSHSSNHQRWFSLGGHSIHQPKGKTFDTLRLLRRPKSSPKIHERDFQWRFGLQWVLDADERGVLAFRGRGSQRYGRVSWQSKCNKL